MTTQRRLKGDRIGIEEFPWAYQKALEEMGYKIDAARESENEKRWQAWLDRIWRERLERR